MSRIVRAALALALAAGALGTLAAAPSAHADEPAPATVERTWFPLRAGDTGALAARLQTRLSWLGYDIDAQERDARVLGPTTIGALHAFQDKFSYARTDEVAKPMWDAIARIAPKPGALPARCTRGTVICIDMTQRLVRLVDDGTVRLSTDARFGIDTQPTRPGSFRVQSRSRDHVSTIYRTAMPFALFFDGDRAIHYSAFFARDGYAGASHGCVNIRDRAKARTLFAAAPVGTPVIVTP